MTTRWIVEKSFKVAGPDYYDVHSLADLRELLQARADEYIATDDHPSLGELEFRYDLDGDDEPIVVYVYFRNKHGDRARFARLVRD